MGPSSARKIVREESPSRMQPVVPKVANDNDRATTRPRDAAIRAAANDNESIRRVQPTYHAAPSRPTVDQEFAASYATKGLQPSVGSITDYNNTQNVPPGISTETRQVRTSQRPTSANQAIIRNPSVEKRLIPKGKIQNFTKARNMNDAASAALPGNLGSYATAAEEASGLVPLTWGIWLTFQVPMALACVAALAIAGIWEKAKEVVNSNIITATLSNIASWTVNTVLDATTGITLEDLSPTNFLLVFVAVTAFIVWAQLLIVGIAYALKGIPCLNGKGSTAKYTALMSALAFGALPILNFIPWASIWVLVVAANPTEED